MSENSTLHIHTRLAPETPNPQTPDKRAKDKRSGRLRLPRRAAPHTAAPVRPGGMSNRLLRNSAIACAVLLGILALGNIRQPWAVKAAEGIERALSMHINLDDSIGELNFVRQIMPESALVFLNVSGRTALTLPADGAVLHPWSSLQPWMLFEGNAMPVYAAEAGTVTAVSALSGGQSGLIIDHGDGLESVYANLSQVDVQSGATVGRGQQLGSSGDGLYFELRESGESVDPSERLGL